MHNLDIFFEDYYLLVLNKPAGIASEASNPNQPCAKKMVLAYLQSNHPERKEIYLGLPHRLDKPVGGILIFAKTPQALKNLNIQFAEKKITKIYHGWVEGEPAQNEMTLKQFIGRDDENKKALIANEPLENFRTCCLAYKLLKKVDGKALLEIELFTGRFHQIRAQLSSINLPIVGDEFYGAKSSTVNTDSILLWSTKYKINHPKTNDELELNLELEPIKSMYK